jgi:FKBP-type peptidyl-prolyl cis-trans isomerase FklB
VSQQRLLQTDHLRNTPPEHTAQRVALSVCLTKKHIMKLTLMAGLALASASTVFAETKPVAPTETKDKVSYSIGADMGSNFKRSGIDVNPDFLAQGIRDALAGKTVMTDEEMKSTIQTWQGEMQAKMEAKQKEADAGNKEASQKFLDENKKKDGVKTTASGLQYKIIKAGDGPKPAATDTVVVNYRGTLTDGTEFDSSYKRNEPASFPVNAVIPGWTEALQMMPVHSKWQLAIPANLAYGDEGRPPVIGPSQALVFEVELLEIKKAEKPAESPAAPAESPAAK